MPRNVRRSVSKGVQDEEEIKRLRQEKRRKKREKANAWFRMVGLTLIEFILCLICFAFAYVYYHHVQKYRNNHYGWHYRKSVRYILLPPTPLAVACVFLSLTYVDLISWKSVRPIPYFAWIMVSTAGFLCFCLYAGVILMTNTGIASIIGIIFGLITALVFLGDLICMLNSLNRFPAPYWVLRRKTEKMDQCLCTEGLGQEEEEVRPICKCGDHWGEPCECDNPDTSCGCGANKTGEPPCDCCECATEMISDDAWYNVGTGASIAPSAFRQSIAPSERHSIAAAIRQSIAPSAFRKSVFVDDNVRSTMVGPDAIDLRKSIANQAFFDLYDATPVHDSCLPTPGMYCMDTQRDSAAGPSRVQLQDMTRKSSMRASQNRTASQIAVVKSLQSPSHRLSVRPSYMRSMSVDARHPSMVSRNRSQIAYSAYSTSIDNKELVRESIAEKQNPNKNKDVKRVLLNESSSDEEIGEGDIPKKKIVVADVVYNPPNEAQTRTIKPRLRHTASNHPSENDMETITLPGQALESENSHRRRNVSVSARERSGKRSCTLKSESETRPKTTRVIRNVSTTVRTLSRVIEADNESRGQQSSSDGVPSGCTITINK